jgi:hypothetical protein
MFRIGFILLIASLRVTSLFSAAQQSPSQPAPPLLVNVLDRNGNAVRDLTKDNFRVKVNNHPAAFLEASYSLAPRRIVVLLDISGSMAGGGGSKKWQIAREAVTDLLTTSPNEVPIALLAFSDHVSTTFGFAEGRPAIAEWLGHGPSQREKLKGRTALFDAAVAGMKLLGPARPGDAIYAITDGGDNSSHTSESQTKELLLLSGIRLFVFLFAEPVLTVEERSGVDSVIDLARDSGGFVFGTSARQRGTGFASWDVTYDFSERTREKIKTYTQALNIQVNGFYTLRVATPVQPGKVGKISLEIVDAAGKTRKDVGFTYTRAVSAGK